MRLSQHPNFIEMGPVEEGEPLRKRLPFFFSNGSAGKDEGLDQNAFTGTRITPALTVVVPSKKTAGQHEDLEQSYFF